MLKILYVHGSQDSEFAINPAHLVGDLGKVRASAEIQKLKAGRVATLGTDGFVKLATKDDKLLGVIINDAAGYEFENTPAIASGKLPLLVGGGLIETDEVKENDITFGDKLYVGDDGIITKTDPGSAPVFGIARSKNSATNKTLKISIL